MRKLGLVLSAVLVLTGGIGRVPADTVVTFNSGAEGWVGPAGPGGSTTIEPTGGNPGAHMHTIFNNFGITFANATNVEFVRDYTATPTFTLGIDIRVESIDFSGTPVSRPWLVELRDYDDPPAGYPWVSVWYKFADVSAAAHGDWTHFEVSVADSAPTRLPAGWGGTGAEDPSTFEPELPPDRTFADVLAGVDEVAFTTLEPGFFFGFTDFDMRLDNIAVVTATGSGPGDTGTLLVAKSGSPGTYILTWQPACGDTAEDYGLYTGTIGNWYDHKPVLCGDTANDGTEALTPPGGDRYFLVVPYDATDEGSYGRDSSGTERPAGAPACRTQQNTAACPSR